MYQWKHVFAAQDDLGEGPVWDPVDQLLYWVDIEGKRYHHLHPASGAHSVVTVGVKIGALALRQRGGLVMATENGFAFWDPAARVLTPIADPEAEKPQSRFNDGAADRSGRFWAGTMDDKDRSSLYRLDPSGAVHIMQGGVSTSNGIGWSPDDRVMYYTDSPTRHIFAYDYDSATGSIANRRVFIDSADRDGVPDGLTVDSQGCVWSARWDGWRIDRYDPQGKWMGTIPMPVQRPTSVMFGGQNLDVLYITSARQGLHADQLAQQPLAGDLFCLEPGVTGLPEPRFAG